MLYENDNNAIGSFKGPIPDKSIIMVINFVSQHLEEFSHQFKGSSINNEKGLTQKLCILLNLHVHKRNLPFWFEKEYIEKPERGDSPQVDLGVISSLEKGITIGSIYFSNRETFFSIEAKRLCYISKAREKEYLVGRKEKGKYIGCGGVERFKGEIHGKGLAYGALIGYVQEHDFNYWYKIVNSWVDKLIKGQIDTTTKWSEKDKLVEEYNNPTNARYKSKNERRTDSIILFHLWVNLV